MNNASLDKALDFLNRPFSEKVSATQRVTRTMHTNTQTKFIIGTDDTNYPTLVFFEFELPLKAHCELKPEIIKKQLGDVMYEIDRHLKSEYPDIIRRSIAVGNFNRMVYISQNSRLKYTGSYHFDLRERRGKTSIKAIANAPVFIQMAQDIDKILTQAISKKVPELTITH